MSEIKKLRELIETHLQAKDKTIKVASYSITNLVPVGSNYGSEILAVEVKLTNGCKKQLVAKLPPTDERFKKLFNIWVTFRKEADFYHFIMPKLHSFQKENSVEILENFAHYYGHRYSLSPALNVVDDNACLLLENVKFDGFIAGKRSELYDLPTTKYILRTLAHFHALPIALKIKKPKVFEEVKRCLPVNCTDRVLAEAHACRVYKLIQHFLEQDPEIAKYAEKIEDLYNISAEHFINANVLGSEPFNTITHNDIWLSNIMLKYDESKKPIGMKIVDLQTIMYGNPGNDILFIIHTSVQPDVITENYDKLIDIYFDEFVSKLKLYNVNVSAFTKEVFLKEVDSAAKCMKFYNVLFMIIPVFMKIKYDSKPDNLLAENIMSSMNDGFAKQLKVIILNWVKHKWL